VLKRILAFMVAVLGGYVFAVLAYSQLNLSNLTDMGVAVGFSDRFGTFAHDVLSMTSMYLPIMTVALLVAFLLAALVLRWVPHLRVLGYVLAGAVGMLAVILFFKVAMGTNPIAVTRTLVGLVSQGLAGAVAGLVYVRVTQGLSRDSAS
jgi:hypothetical protein